MQVDSKPLVNCFDCKGTGFIKTEIMHYGRGKYSYETDGLVYPIIETGQWRKEACHCLEEN